MIASRSRQIVRTPKAQTRTQARRTKRVLCEALEDRQMLSLTIELRAADGSSSATVNTVGQQITLNIIGVISAGTAGSQDTDVSSSNPNTFGIGSLTGSILSSAGMGLSGTVGGNLTATVAQPFEGPGFETGRLQDLNGDGNIDVGSNLNSTSTNDYWLGQSESEVTTGTVVGNTKQIILGTTTYTVTNLNQGGETDINFRLRVENLGYFVANWFDGISYQGKTGQGHYANEYLSTLAVGTPFVITDPALVVAPTAVNDTSSVIRNTPTSINVIANDIFVRPADKTSLLIGTAPQHGTAIPQTDGTVLYTPSTGYTGPDSFTYTVDDTDGRVSNAATVSITVVTPPPPVAGTVTASTLKNQPDGINVLSSDTATSPATIVPADVQVVGVPAHGTAIPQSDGSILYTPTTGYTGTDSFTYTVQDTNGEVSSPGTVNVTVNAPTPPTAGDVTSTTTAGAPVTITVLTSDTTPQGQLSAGSVTVVTQPTNGSAVAQPNGTIIYTPTAKYVGADSFSYTVADNFGDVSAPGTVSLTISAGVPPVANPVTAPAVSGQTNTIDVLSNASGGAPLVPSSVAVVTPPTNGTATVNTSTGAIAYVPNAGFVGTDTFTYTVADVNGDTSAPASVSVDVGTTISSTKGAAHSLTFTDAAGGLETVTLNKGSAELFFSGTGGSVTVGKNLKAVVTGTSLELSGITLSGTAANSTLSIRGSAKTPVTIGGIVDNSPMGSINLTNATLGGTVTLTGARSINALSINGATITVGSASAGRLSLTTGVATDSSLTSTVPISTVKATSWSDTASSESAVAITAPSVTSLSVAGAFDASIVLSATGKALALGSVRIGGAVGGSFVVPGSTGSVTLGSVSSPGLVSPATTFGTINSLTIRSGGLSEPVSFGALGSLVVNGDVTGTISATSARSIRVNGNFNGSGITVTGALTQLSSTGSLVGDNITVGGNLNSLTAAGMNGTNISVGTTGNTVNLADANSAALGTSTIGSIRLTGRTGDQFTNSTILAGKINTASLGSVTTANGGTPLGIAAKSVGTFSGIFAGAPLHAPHSALINDTLLTSFLQQQGVSFGDFEILITG